MDMPNCNGIVDTGIGLFFEPISHLYQDVNWIVVERPTVEVKASLARLGWPAWGTDALASSLQKVKKRAKLVVPYDQIDKMAPEIWKACGIPYKFDKKWWDKMKAQNLQDTELPEKVPPLFIELAKWIG